LVQHQHNIALDAVVAVEVGGENTSSILRPIRGRGSRGGRGGTVGGVVSTPITSSIDNFQNIVVDQNETFVLQMTKF
jgi:hypothetical protein